MTGFAACLLLGGAAQAENPAPQTQDPKAQSSRASEVEKQRLQYQGVQDTLAQSEAQRQKIEAEIASFQNDRAALTKALLDAKQKIDDAENRAAEAQKRLDELIGGEAAIRRSLESRRGVLIEVLAALQRMGRKPPPALLAQPRDVLHAIRAAIALGAVLPQLRGETEALANDLRDLVTLRESIAAERASLAAELETRRSERARLEALIAERQKSIGEAEGALAAERARAQALASQAASLKDLLARMEGELEFVEKSRRTRAQGRGGALQAFQRGRSRGKGADSPIRASAIPRASLRPSPSTTPRACCPCRQAGR